MDASDLKDFIEHFETTRDRTRVILEEERKLSEELSRQFARIDKADDNALEIINHI